MSHDKVVSEKEARNVKRLLAAASNGIADNLGSLVDRPLSIKPGAMQVQDSDEVLGGISGGYCVVRGALDKDFAGKTLRVMLAVPDAVALAAAMMMTPEEVIAERRKAGTIVGEDLEAFGEVANILCSGMDEVLRSKVEAPIGLRLQDHGVVRPGVDDGEILGDGSEDLLSYAFELKIANYPPTTGYLLIDLETAEAWNGKPFLVADLPHADGAEEKRSGGRGGLLELSDEAFEDIPAADIRGRMAGYFTDSKVFDIVRRSCRRVGLELRRGGRGEVPNPAAHHGEFVLIDVPVGDDRRFDWCKRVKSYDPAIRVILLVHMPSRSRVLRGFMARADAILAWPLTEPELSAKLNSMLEALAGGTVGSSADAEDPAKDED